MEFTKRIEAIVKQRSELWGAIVISFIALLLYGPLSASLGLYYDDWPSFWAARSDNPLTNLLGVSHDRPAGGVLMYIVSSVLPESPIAWHITVVVLASVLGVLIWLIMLLLSPSRKLDAFIVAVLFTVYPGIKFHSSAWIFTHAFFIPAILYFFSLYLMLVAIRHKKYFASLTLCGASSALLSFVIVEYFVGLEIARIALVYVALAGERSPTRKRINDSFRYVWPYFLVWLGYVLWRLFVFESPRSATSTSAIASQFLAHPTSEIFSRFGYMINDYLETTVIAWAETFSIEIFDIASRSNWLAWFLAAILFFSVTFILNKIEPGESDSDNRSWAKVMIALGSVCVIFSLLPIWFIGQEASLVLTSSRFAIPSVLGATLVTTGVLSYLCSNKNKIVVVAILVSTSAMLHIRTANEFRHEWIDLKNVFWELAWRAPSLKPGTVIFFAQNTNQYTGGDYSFGIPLNLLYDEQNKSTKVNYWAMRLERRLPGLMASASEESSFQTGVRNIEFSGDLTNALVLWYQPGHCVRLLDKSETIYSEIPSHVTNARWVSNIDRIDLKADSAPQLPLNIFGPELEHEWCYYYQKASLALQAGDWDEIVRLAEDVKSFGYGPNIESEWLPFWLGYKNLGMHSEEKVLFERMCGGNYLYRVNLCKDISVSSLDRDPPDK
jgi:hypothetical protein